jgi:hypothetical protein
VAQQLSEEEAVHITAEKELEKERTRRGMEEKWRVGIG